MKQWDNGELVLALLSDSPYFAWDSRDQFSVSEAKKVINTLVERDPSKFVAKAYVSYLIEEALAHTKVNLASVLLDPNFSAYSKEILTAKVGLDEDSGPDQEAFFHRVSSSLSQLGIELTLTRHEQIRLLRDAVCLADLPVTWFNSNGSEYCGPIQMNEVIYRYTDWLSLEIAIRNRSICDGFHFVMIDNQAGNACNHAFVFISPTHSCWFAKSHWDFYASELITDNQYQGGYSGTPITQINPHFPDFIPKDSLVVRGDEHCSQFGNLSSLNESEAMWILMLMELLSRRLPTLLPGNLSVSSGLLIDSFEPKNLLPMLWAPPFALSHHTLEEALEAVGVNNSQMSERIHKLLAGLKIEHLLPEMDKLGFNVDTLWQGPEFGADYHNSSSSRYGREPSIPYGQRSNLLNLYPRPERHVGTEDETTKVFNMVIERNLAMIINRKIMLDWDDNIKEVRSFLASMCKKKSKEMISIWLSEFTEVVSPRSGLKDYTSMATGFVHPGQSPKLVTKITTDTERFITTENIMVNGGHFESEDGRLGFKGYLTRTKDPDKYLLMPADKDDIRKLFKCRESSIPSYLMDYVRCLSHDQIKYPWDVGRMSDYPICLFFYH